MPRGAETFSTRVEANQALRDSEERFRTFTSATSDVVYRMSPDWTEMRYLAGRDFIEDTLEPSASWLEKYIDLEDRPKVMAAIQEAIRSRSVFELEHRVIRVDGSKGWTSSRAIPILDESGEIVEWFGAASDVTRRMEAESQLRHSVEKYRTLFDSVDVGFCIIEVLFDDADKPFDYRFLEANPAFAAQTMLTSAIGKTIRELAPQHEQFWFDMYGDIARTGKSVRFEHQATALPVYRWYEVYAFPIGAAGENRVAVMFRDIADRKRREWIAGLLAEVTDEANRLTAPDEIMQLIGARAAEFLGLSFCAFVDVDDDRGEVTVHHAWVSAGVPSPKSTFRLADYLSEEFSRANRSGETVIVRDTSADARVNADTIAQRAIGSFVTVPHHRGGRWTAYLAVATVEPRDWQKDDIEFLQQLANRLFPRIDRARAEEAMRASEAKYRSLFESIDEGFCIIELVLDETDGSVVDVIYREVNEAFQRQSGVAQEVVGKRASEIFQRLSQARLDIFTRVRDTGEAVHSERYSPETDRWYRLHYARIGAAGSLLQSIVFEDISERRSRERQREYLLKLSDALRALSDSVAIESTAFRLLGEQLGADRVYYAKLDEAKEQWIIGREYSRGTSPSVLGTYPLSAFDWAMPSFRRGDAVIINDATDLNIIPAEFSSALKTFQILSAISVPLIKNGELVQTLAVTDSSPRTWSADDIELVSETLERTWAAVERTIADEARRASEAELRDANRRKDEFLAMLAHELRNPLAPLRTGLEFMRVANGSSQSVEPVRAMMERQVTHMVRLIDDLLDVSRITSGKIKLQREATLLADIVSNAVEANRAALDAARVELQVSVPSKPIILDVDRTRMVQVLSNLLHNAVKFTPASGRVEVSARVTAPENTNDEAWLSLTVSDNGAGIAKDILPSIFELFTQGEQSPGSSVPGLGIGLALAKHLVEMHDGRIHATSEGADRGSTFVIELPVPIDKAAATTRLRVDHTIRLWQRILIIDDNRDAAEAMGMLINALGGQARIAHEGAAGLHAVTEFRPDVVLLDIGMPGMDGYETCRRIRAEAKGRNVLIVAVTGWGQDQDKQRAIDAGFDAHITKPAELESLERIMASAKQPGP